MGGGGVQGVGVLHTRGKEKLQVHDDHHTQERGAGGQGIQLR